MAFFPFRQPRNLRTPQRRKRAAARGKGSTKPSLETLEHRLAPAVNIWQGVQANAGEFSWSTPANWSLGVVPGVNDVASFKSNGPGSLNPCTIDASSVVSVQGINIDSTYTSAVTDNATSNTIGSSGFIQAGGTFTVVDATPTPVSITVSGNWTESATFNSGTTGTVTFNAASGTQKLNSGGQGFANLTHSGNGTLQLTSNPLTVSGQLTNSAGTFDANGQNTTVTGLTTLNAATYQDSGAGSTANQAFNGGLVLTNATLASAAAGLITLGGDVTETPAANGHQSAISGNLSLGSRARTFTLTRGSGAQDLAVSAVISGTGSLTEAGTGILLLSANNSYSGGTTLSAGTLALGNTNALGSGALALNGGVLEGNGTGLTVANTLNLGGNAAIGGTTDLTLTGTTTSAGGNWTLNVTDTGLTTLAGTVGQAAASSLGLTKAGAGKLLLLGANTYSGGTTLNAGGGTLAVGNATDLGTGTLTINGGVLQGNGTALTLANALAFNGDFTVGGTSDLTLTGGVTLAGGRRTVTVTNTGLTTLAGAIAATTLGLTKAGAGTLVLSSGANAYTGSTIINAGTLWVNGSLTSSALTVNSGGTLGGTGTVGVVTVSGGTLSPGTTGPGKLTTNGNVSFTSASFLNVLLNGTTAGTGYSQLVVSGAASTVSLGSATLGLTLGFTSNVGDSFKLIDNQGSSAVTGTFGNTFPITVNNQQFNINYASGDGNDVVLTHTPGAATQLAFGQQPTNSGAGMAISPAVTVKVEDSSGNVVTADNSMVTLTLSSGKFEGGSTTVTVAAMNGIATFSNLKIDAAGSYTLAGTDGSLTATGPSQSFTVSPAAANKLIYVQGPSSTTYGNAIRPAVTVDIVDQFGNLRTNDTTNITLVITVGTGSPGAVLNGGAATSASGGVATFSNLMINQVGTAATSTAYELDATAAGLTTATSSPFDITERAITVTAAVNSKIYDGNLSATATPTITSGSLAAGDTANFTETYDTKNVGSGKTLTPTGTVNDGNAGNNYSYTFVTNTSGVITTRSLTVSATGVDKVYDGTNAATVTLSDNRVSGDQLTDSYTSASFADPNVGTGKTVNVSGSTITGPDSTNYTLGNTTTTTTANITKANATIVVNPYSITYDGTSHTATGSATGVLGENLAGLDLSGTTHTNAGSSTDTWTFTDVTGNYNNTSGTVSDSIGKANATIVVNPYSVTYDGTAHTATGSATGVLSENLAGLDLSGTTHTNAGSSTDTWTFTDVTGNYNNTSGTVSDSIGKANATIVVNPYSVTYDGTAHTATGSATGVLGENLAGLDLSGTTHTNAGSSTDTWTFTDVTGNYNNASGTISDSIGKASATITVTPYSVSFDGNPHTATGMATGVLGESLSGLDLSGTTHTNPGTYTDTWTFTDVTGNYNNASGTVTDSIGQLSVSGSPLGPITEGSSTGTVQVATFTDGNSTGNTGNYSATIDWGDGTPANPDTSLGTVGYDSGLQVYTVRGSHTYQDNLPGNTSYTITITVTRTGGPSVSGSTSIQVTNVAPTAGISAPTDGFQGVQGQGRPFNLTAGDPSPADMAAGFTYVINWGDGTQANPDVQTIAATANNGNGLAVNHTFTAAGTYTISVTATDQDGATGSAVTRNVTILVAEQQGSGLAVGGTAGKDTFTFTPGSAANNLTVKLGTKSYGPFTVTAPVLIFGQAGTDKVTINGSTGGGNAFTVNGLHATLNGFNFQGNSIESWVFTGHGNNNSLTVLSTAAGVPVTFSAGTGSNNTIQASNSNNSWVITAKGAGKLTTTPATGSVAFTGAANLIGGTGVDVFKLNSNGKVSSINGGGGGDWLDYSSFTAGVTVDLTTGSATNVNGGAAGAVTNIQNVRGGSGADLLTGNGGNILVGGGGNDTLIDAYTGSTATGRSLLIGGTGGASLTAGSAGDILISGKTSYDTNNAALAAILAEWQSADDYNTRFTKLQAGVGASHTKLVWGTTVLDDGMADTLNGSTAGLDWFFANLSQDTINNLNQPAHEHVNNSF
jgi:autotransporter-associated beta strand protein